MNVIKISPYGFGCNSYILTSDEKRAIVVDCASDNVYIECIKRNLTPVAVLLTHGHFDHIGGCGKFYKSGVPIYCGESERELIFSKEYLSLCDGLTIPHFEIYRTFSGGEKLEIGGLNIEVIKSAGHSAGGVCYLIEGELFTGDTLFFESIGRSDLYTGNYKQLKESVKGLFSLNGDCIVHCGHGRDTTLDYERKYNPYVKFI